VGFDDRDTGPVSDASERSFPAPAAWSLPGRERGANERRVAGHEWPLKLPTIPSTDAPRSSLSNPAPVPSRESAQGFLKLFHGGLPGPGIALSGQNRGPKADLRDGKAGVTGDLCGRRRLPHAKQVLRCAEVDHPDRHRHTDGSVDEWDDNRESRPDDFPAPSQAKDCQEFTLPHRADRGHEKDEDDRDADKRGASEYFLLSREDPPATGMDVWGLKDQEQTLRDL